MSQQTTSLLGRLSAISKLEILSANLAIGTASAFVLATAAASLAVDRESPNGGIAGGNWSLRGSLVPNGASLPAAGPVQARIRVPAKQVVAGL